MSYFCVDNEIMTKIKFRWSAKFKGFGNRVNKKIWQKANIRQNFGKEQVFTKILY